MVDLHYFTLKYSLYELDDCRFSFTYRFYCAKDINIISKNVKKGGHSKCDTHTHTLIIESNRITMKSVIRFIESERENNKYQNEIDGNQLR